MVFEEGGNLQSAILATLHVKVLLISNESLGFAKTPVTIDCDDSVGIRFARGLPQDRLPSVIHRLKRKIRIIIRSR